MVFVSTCPWLYARELNIVSDGNDRSVLVIKVYQKHRVGKDTLVGGLTDTIGEVLRKLKDGGTKMIL